MSSGRWEHWKQDWDRADPGTLAAWQAADRLATLTDVEARAALARLGALVVIGSCESIPENAAPYLRAAAVMMKHLPAITGYDQVVAAAESADLNDPNARP